MPATLPNSQDLKAILEHVRGQFQYHAGQRLNTIRYYFVAYAIFVAAYVGTFSGSAQAPAYVRCILAMTAFLVTLAFWGLEIRNAQLVKVDERAVNEIEQLVATQYAFEHFRMTESREQPDQRFLKYRFIIRCLFFLFAVSSGVAAVRDFVRVVCP